MQIGDLYSQYQNNYISGSDIATGVRGVEQVSDTVSKLQAGQVFEGSVTEIKGDRVTLSLSNGQSISARLDGDLSFGKGESVFFEVKSNDGGTVQIRPVSMGITNNPTLIDALSQAGLSSSENNINMVRQMMEEQLPIDAKSLLAMSKAIAQSPGADPASIVTMTKLGIPTSPEMVSQFENYKANEGAIMKAYSEMVDSMAESFSGENVSAKDIADFQKNLVSVLQLSGEDETLEPAENDYTAENVEQEALSKASGEGQNTASDTARNIPLQQEAVLNGDLRAAINGESKPVSPEALSPEQRQISSEENPGANTGRAETVNAESRTMAAETLEGKEALTGQQELRQEGADSSIPKATDIIIREGTGEPVIQTEYPKNSIGSLLSEQDSATLNDMLKNHPELLDKEGRIDLKNDATEFMNRLTDAFQKSGAFSKEDLLKLISSDPYKKLMNGLMEKQWTVKPEELKKEDQIGKLYEKLETHLSHLEETARQLSGNSENLFSKTAQSVRENIDFMNQVNQMATYVQIPLKFANQNATGDLYVYRNKKSKSADNDELTAFLHFDLEHLGSTDISVKLKGKNVDTQFFMADDASYSLIEKNLPILEKRLRDKGYSANITVSNDSEPVDFVKDFLAKDIPAAPKASMQRFSFDVRA